MFKMVYQDVKMIKYPRWFNQDVLSKMVVLDKLSKVVCPRHLFIIIHILFFKALYRWSAGRSRYGTSPAHVNYLYIVKCIN